MSSWRSTILNEFVPNVAKLTLVSDPDSLLTEEKLSLELRERGFDLIEFQDPIEFRFVYESKYRSIWDEGKHTDLVVTLRLQDNELDSLPFDLLQAGRKLSFDLGKLFPNLSYPVIEKLDLSSLDALYGAQQISSPDRMGDNATKDFILRHVYGVAAELVSTEVDLLRSLLRLHYGKIVLPTLFAERLVDVLKQKSCFKDWPLEQIVLDAEEFFAFIQERWPIFISVLESKSQVKEASVQYGLRYAGPSHLPFDHQDIRVYIDNLFVEGKLLPTEAAELELDQKSWLLSGVTTPITDESDTRISRLFDLLKSESISSESGHAEWISYAMKWAELSALMHTAENEKNGLFKEIGAKVNKTFADWLKSHYASLINLPPSNPAMLHHVARRLVRDIEDHKNGRVALLVVDGLSLDQWVTVRGNLQKQNSDLVFRESATFAWIPTLTSVSRQAIFSGKPPIYFPSSIDNTNSELKLWRLFWQGYDLAKHEIVYKRGLGDGDAEDILDSLINPSQTRVVGLVIDKVDKIMHGMQLGSAGMHSQIDMWMNGRFLVNMIHCLQNHDYEVWLTSDHGNIECTGRGKPSEGAIAENRGERVRVYPTPELRAHIHNSLTFTREWEPVGLPETYYPLVTQGQEAFISEGSSIVGHGGVSIEEVIVPLVKIERRKR